MISENESSALLNRCMGINLSFLCINIFNVTALETKIRKGITAYTVSVVRSGKEFCDLFAVYWIKKWLAKLVQE